MRLRGVTYALGFMLAVISLQACKQKPKINFEPIDQAGIIEALGTIVEDPKPFGVVLDPYTWPACPEDTYIPLQEEIAVRIPAPLGWRDQVNQIKLQVLLDIYQEGLTQDNAVQLALVNNPDLFAYYENLELRYADLLEAGLLKNPAFEKSMGIKVETTPVEKKNAPQKDSKNSDQKSNDNSDQKSDENSKKDSKKGKQLQVEPDAHFGMTMDFLEYFLVPFRQQAALADLEVTEADVQQKVLDLVREVEITWLILKSEEQEYAQRKQLVELTELAFKLSQLQTEAGNNNTLVTRAREIAFLEAGENLNSTRVKAAREKMNRTLGLFGNEACWNTGAVIDWRIGVPFLNIPALELAALENRPDIESIRREINALAQEAKLKDPWTYANLTVAHTSDNESSGSITNRTAIALEYPIYDYGQAEEQKYLSLIEQAQQRLLDRAVDACSEVREFTAIGKSYQSSLEDYEKNILPGYRKQIAEVHAEYNVMTMGVYALFDIKMAEIDGKIEYIHALRDYFIQVVELLHATGGSLVPVGGSP